MWNFSSFLEAVLWIIIGVVIGSISQLMTNRRSEWVVNALFAITGALLVAWGGVHLKIYPPHDATSFIAAAVGAVVLTALYHMVLRRHRRIP